MRWPEKTAIVLIALFALPLFFLSATSGQTDAAWIYPWLKIVWFLSLKFVLPVWLLLRGLHFVLMHRARGPRMIIEPDRPSVGWRRL